MPGFFHITDEHKQRRYEYRVIARYAGLFSYNHEEDYHHRRRSRVIARYAGLFSYNPCPSQPLFYKGCRAILRLKAMEQDFLL